MLWQRRRFFGVTAGWLAGVALGLSALCAAEFDRAKLAQIGPTMQKFVDDKQVAGVVTVVGSSAGIADIQTVGWSKLAGNVPLQKDSLFRIASMTKPITALGVMLLQEEGQLSVEDPVEKHLPEFKGQMLVAERKDGTVTLKKPSRPITIRDLMTHTSGLPGGFPMGLADLYNRRHLTLAEGVLVSSQQPLEFEPGTKWAYCNAGIDTLGRIIEVCSGQSYEDFLVARVFLPLGMKDTRCFISEEQAARTVGLYERRGDVLVEVEKPLVGPARGAKHPIPAGGLLSTAPDLAKLYAALLNKGTLDGKRIISEQSLKTMTSVQTGDLKTGFVDGMGFGFGFAVVREPKGATEMVSAGTYGHGGAFGTQGWIDPHKDVFVILLIQRAAMPGGDGSDLRKSLQAIAFGAVK